MKYTKTMKQRQKIMKGLETNENNRSLHFPLSQQIQEVQRESYF
jgi:hypothetical protein